MTSQHWTTEQDGRLTDLFCGGAKIADIAQVFGRSERAIWNRASVLRLSRAGTGHEHRRAPIPDDFDEHAPGLTFNAARLRWRTSAGAVRRWYAEKGVPFAVAPQLEKVKAPAGFAHFAAIESTPRLMQRFGLGQSTVRRLRKEFGIAAIVPPRGANLARSTSADAPAGLGSVVFAPARKPGAPPRTWRAPSDDTRGGVAADFLRRRGFTPVFRAQVADRKAPRDAWIVGRRQMSEADMIALAAEKGFVRFDQIPVTSTNQGARA